MRLDRNRHGGVVLMYVLDKYIVKRPPSHTSLELLTVNGNYCDGMWCQNHDSLACGVVTR